MLIFSVYLRIDYQWGGKIGITANRFPQVGRLSQHPNVFYAQGYSGHDLNVTHWTARLLALGMLWYRMREVLG